MNVVGLRPAAFRHVVFPEVTRVGPAVNFANASTLSSCARTLSPVAITEEQTFLRWLLDQGGLDSCDYKLETLRRRVPSCLRALRVSTLSEARQLVQRNPSMLR